jgi:hypothetical protein
LSKISAANLTFPELFEPRVGLKVNDDGRPVRIENQPLWKELKR